MIERIVIKGYRIFHEFEMLPNPTTNIVVGDNESGKSTLLEAITLALTCRVNGRWARDELNPYWFNRQDVDAYFASLGTENPLSPPEILVELYFTKDDDAFQLMRGVYNSLQDKDAPGISVRISPSEDYAVEFAAYIEDPERPEILPVEFYKVDWKDFSDAVVTRRPKHLGLAIIDSATIRSTSGVDFHTREMLGDFVEEKERAAISVAHRSARHTITNDKLADANKRISDKGPVLHDSALGLQIDQSSNASWESSIVPQVGDIPFAMSGQGQQAAIKVALAMNRDAEKTAYVLVEEPENHLSHTSLTKLVGRIEKLAGTRQIFLTTHSSFVLNRLGLDKLHLLHQGTTTGFEALKDDTVRYFKRLSGYDTLRLVLARELVLVEGPSDEMTFERAFIDKHDETPVARGIDVVSMRGVALSRSLQLCAALGRKVAALRDNDGKDPTHWEEPQAEWLEDGVRVLFIGALGTGDTLEPQILHVNDEETIRKILELEEGTDVLDWMTGHKTEAALKIAESQEKITYPKYILAAIEFVE